MPSAPFTARRHPLGIGVCNPTMDRVWRGVGIGGVCITWRRMGSGFRTVGRSVTFQAVGTVGAETAAGADWAVSRTVTGTVGLGVG